MGLNKINVWHGIHRGIGYEVRQHGISSDYNPNGIFCGYLYLNSVKNPEILGLRGHVEWMERYKPELPKIESHRHNEFFDRFNWNGGITFYEEITTIGETVLMKIGHDYVHLWDKEFRRDESYDAEHIEARLKLIIDEYREIHPEQKESE